jgi:hypothetical protein
MASPSDSRRRSRSRNPRFNISTSPWTGEPQGLGSSAHHAQQREPMAESGKRRVPSPSVTEPQLQRQIKRRFGKNEPDWENLTPQSKHASAVPSSPQIINKVVIKDGPEGYQGLSLTLKRPNPNDLCIPFPPWTASHICTYKSLPSHF